MQVLATPLVISHCYFVWNEVHDMALAEIDYRRAQCLCVHEQIHIYNLLS
jgi:hypothetical protein